MRPTVETIETAINQLSLAEQFRLMERLMRRIRSRALRAPAVPEDDLEAMARDPAIQQELRQIAAEFAGTEADGLDSA
jgi:hypothetical protein